MRKQLDILQGCTLAARVIRLAVAAAPFRSKEQMVQLETGDLPSDAPVFPQEEAVMAGAVDNRRRALATVCESGRATSPEPAASLGPLGPGDQ